MDIYDPGLMAASGRIDGTSTPTGDANDKPKTELDQNVEKLVGNISNWWSGIAKKSQDSITQARKEMENRGGIVNYAKSEYAKLESSLGDAQKKARDQSQTASQPGEIDSTSEETRSEDTSMQSENSKGKQRAIDDQDPAAEPKAGTVSNQGPTLGASVSSLFSKLTTDPRLVQLQHSLTSTLQSTSSPQAQDGQKEGDDATPTRGGAPVKLQESLSKLSLTIQSHLPHLDLKESQQLATKYLHATESFAREMQSDMKEFVGELVRVVPPEGEDVSANPTPSTAVDSAADNSKTSTAAKLSSEAVEANRETHKDSNTATSATGAATRQTAAATAAPADEEEEDFAWDEDDEEAAATSVAIPAAPLKREKSNTDDAAAPTATEIKASTGKDDDTEEDSDWE